MSSSLFIRRPMHRRSDLRSSISRSSFCNRWTVRRARRTRARPSNIAARTRSGACRCKRTSCSTFRRHQKRVIRESRAGRARSVTGAAVALEDDESPRRQFAVVRHPRPAGEDFSQLFRRGARPGHRLGGPRAARQQQVQTLRRRPVKDRAGLQFGGFAHDDYTLLKQVRCLSNVRTQQTVGMVAVRSLRMSDRHRLTSRSQNARVCNMTVIAEKVDFCDPVWSALRAQAEELGREEPALASFAHAVILKHERLEDALSFHLAKKIGGDELSPMLAREIFEDAMKAEPAIGDAARADLSAIFERDPACHSYAQAFLFFKGFQALQCHRIAHWLWDP